MGLKLITPPAPAVTLTEAKWHLRVDDDESDDYLEDVIIPAATAILDGPEGRLRRAIMPQTWEAAFDRFPSAEIRLPLGPVISVTSVLYDDEDGLEQTVSTSDYDLDAHSELGWVVPTTAWPATISGINAVRVRWQAGHTTCPPEIKAAILLLIGHLFRNREAVSDGSLEALPLGVDSLIAIRKRLIIA